MQTFIIRRLLIGVVILFILSVAVFALLRIVPGRSGDPHLRAELHDRRRSRRSTRRWGSTSRTAAAVLGDWISGDSQYGSETCGDVELLTTSRCAPQVRHRFPVTFEIMVLTMIMTIIVGVPFGIISAVSRNSPATTSCGHGAVLGLAVPVVLGSDAGARSYRPRGGATRRRIGRAIPITEDPIGNLKQFGPPLPCSRWLRRRASCV